MDRKGAMPRAASNHRNRRAFDEPDIGVIIPTYNRQKILRRAIDSVLDQGPQIACVIIIDDGSEPATRISYSDPRIQCIRIPHCGFPGKVRNIGMQNIHTPWLAFLDSDDVWLPEKLNEQRMCAEETGAMAVFTREKWLRNGKIRCAPEPIKDTRDLFCASLEKCVMGPSTMMMKTKVFRSLGGFREDLVFAEDYECWIRMLLQGVKISAVDRPLIVKEAGLGDNLSEITPMREFYRLKALAGIIEKTHNTGALEDWQKKAIERAFSRKIAIVKTGALKRGNKEMLHWLEKLPNSRGIHSLDPDYHFS